jgi:hypothetical protein
VHSSSRARAAFVLLYGALLAWQIDRWCFTPHGIVSTWAHRASSSAISAASPSGLTQSFTMGADGFDGIWLRPSAATGVPRGDLLVDLVAVEGTGRARLERVALPASDVVRTASVWVPWRPVTASRGRHFEIHVRHLHAEGGPDVRLAVTREDALASGQLTADGVEQWGDLVFETSSRRATLPYWLHEVLRPWPAWMRTGPVVTFVLLTFNLVLAWACAMATGIIGPSAAGAQEDRRATLAGHTMPAPVAVGRVAVLIVSCLVVGGLTIAARPTGRYRALDLIDALPDARVQTTWGPMHAAVSAESVLFGTRVHRAIVAMPPSTIAWTVDVPREAVLRAGAAMRPDAWERVGDGIEMRVHVDHAGGRTTPVALTLYPLGEPAHRRLFPLEVPLHAWAGQRVTIVFETTPERWGNAVNDVPVWTDPRIEWSRNPAAGTARTVRP